MVALVMAGGVGTRFWPLSRRSRPKQLLSLGDHPVMLRATLDRLRPLLPPERILVVTGRAHEEPARRVCDDLPPENVVAEPEGRDTAACVGLGGVLVEERFSPDTVIGVFPADHHIGRPERFHADVRAARDACGTTGDIVTFGVRPDDPSTSYGYILYDEETSVPAGERSAFAVERFTEKPDRDEARSLLEQKALWNSGMFFWQARTILDLIGKHLPRLSEGLDGIREDWTARGDLPGVLEDHYGSLPAISVDYGVLERADRVWTLPVDFDWSDLGTWDKLGDVVDTDEDGNVRLGESLLYDCRESVVVREGGPLVGAVGLRGLVVVSTEDALLVCPRKRVEDVREIVRSLKDAGRDELL